MNKNYNFGGIIELINFNLSKGEIAVLKTITGHIARKLIDNYPTFLNIKITKEPWGISVIINYKDNIQNIEIEEENIYYAIGGILQNI